MPQIPEAIISKLAHLPDTPGVYLWKAADGTVLYVGKAKRLRPRVRSYWADQTHSPKTQMLMALVADLETIVVPSRRRRCSSSTTSSRSTGRDSTSCFATTRRTRM